MITKLHALILCCIFSIQAFANTETFYGLPVPANINHVKVKDGQYDKYATMRFATQKSPKEILSFYQASLTQELDISHFKNTTIIAFDIGQVKKLISITNYMGLADVVLQSDK